MTTVTFSADKVQRAPETAGRLLRAVAAGRRAPAGSPSLSTLPSPRAPSTRSIRSMSAATVAWSDSATCGNCLYIGENRTEDDNGEVLTSYAADRTKGRLERLPAPFACILATTPKGTT